MISVPSSPTYFKYVSTIQTAELTNQRLSQGLEKAYRYLLTQNIEDNEGDECN